jgi:hypothetical protein
MLGDAATAGIAADERRRRWHRDMRQLNAGLVISSKAKHGA